MVTLSPKKKKDFSRFSRRILLLSEKLLIKKIFKNIFSIKKLSFVLAARCTTSLKREMALKTIILHFLGKHCLF